MSDLDQALLTAHVNDDKAALVRLYTLAADGAGDIDAACFYLTHAYVFALEIGAPATAALHQRLLDHGRV